MKYKNRKTPTIASKAAAEVKRLLDKQNPPLGYSEVASMIGVHSETMRSIVNDSRVPSPGVINGLARVLELSQREVNHLFDLRRDDVLTAKLRSVTGESKDGNNNGDQFAEIFVTLSKEQRELLMKSALRFAKGNEKGQK